MKMDNYTHVIALITLDGTVIYDICIEKGEATTVKAEARRMPRLAANIRAQLLEGYVSRVGFRVEVCLA